MRIARFLLKISEDIRNRAPSFMYSGKIQVLAAYIIKM